MHVFKTIFLKQLFTGCILYNSINMYLIGSYIIYKKLYTVNIIYDNTI